MNTFDLLDIAVSGRERRMDLADVHALALDRIYNAFEKRTAVPSAIPGVAGTGRHSQDETGPEGSPLADRGPATVGVLSDRATAERYLGKRIVTVHVFPPIPCRRMDWCAYPDGEEEDGNYGWGATEAAAIADLIEILRDAERLPIRGAL